jgi:hypothetical protein
MEVHIYNSCKFDDFMNKRVTEPSLIKNVKIDKEKDLEVHLSEIVNMKEYNIYLDKKEGAHPELIYINEDQYKELIKNMDYDESKDRFILFKKGKCPFTTNNLILIGTIFILFIILYYFIYIKNNLLKISTPNIGTSIV